MASHHIDTGRAAALPLNLLAQAIPMLTRNELASLTERLIDVLDAGDPDLEPNGDELDGTGAEDEELLRGAPNVGEFAGAGCPISDPDCAVDDKPCDEDFDRETEPYEIGDFSDPDARRDHRERIRQTRCTALRERDWRTGRRDGPVYRWMFLDEPSTPSRRKLLRRKRGMPKRPRA